MKQLTEMCWFFIAVPYTSDVFGNVGTLNLALGLVTSLQLYVGVLNAVGRILTYMGSITVHLACLDSAALLRLNNNRFTCLAKSNLSKLEVSHTVIFPL